MLFEDGFCGAGNGGVVFFPSDSRDGVAVSGLLWFPVTVEFGAVQFTDDEVNAFAESLRKGFSAGACELLSVGVESKHAFGAVWNLIGALPSAMRSAENDRELSALDFNETRYRVGVTRCVRPAHFEERWKRESCDTKDVSPRDESPVRTGFGKGRHLGGGQTQGLRLIAFSV